MDAHQFKAAIGGMSEANTREILDPLDRARAHAMLLRIRLRLPERAAFGAIAEDLDYALSIIPRVVTSIACRRDQGWVRTAVQKSATVAAG
ncbi:hypothetical protein E4191_18360 (plasmid) [Paracoccus liaowanqingii]|uniref:Uncharacterized protein n=1 Tax=Paracoccus liaowanqingii TaxID=2560053 RepID=A0A4Y5SRY0_9RHOB|nr:hypothetical protein [Paracoccus liaowanqingii]QDA36089.1 hypothetical protein E4191_18360 [Paracoccus liaowanqingii]